MVACFHEKESAMNIHRIRPVILMTTAFVLSVSCLSLLPTSTPPFQVWEGPPRPLGETATFTYKGTGAYGLLLYAIDGQPRSRHGDNRLLEGSFSNTLMCGFDVTVLPGEHSFEFYTVDTNPLQIFTLRFPMAAGKTYALEGSSKVFKVTLEGAPIMAAREDVPAIIEPAEGDPHATLEFRREGGAMDVNAYLLRIDGKIRSPMYKRHPRWAVMNYSGLASGIVNSIGGTGMLVQANVEADEGKLSIRLEPGRHHIEYFVETMYLGQRGLGDSVRSLDFDFESGKSYRIVLERDPVKVEGVEESSIAIVGK